MLCAKYGACVGIISIVRRFHWYSDGILVQFSPISWPQCTSDSMRLMNFASWRSLFFIGSFHSDGGSFSGRFSMLCCVIRKAFFGFGLPLVLSPCSSASSLTWPCILVCWYRRSRSLGCRLWRSFVFSVVFFFRLWRRCSVFLDATGVPCSVSWV